MNSRLVFLLIISICTINNYAYCEEGYYYGFDDKISINLVPNKIALYQEGNTTKEEIINFLSKHQLTASWKHDKLCIVENNNFNMLRRESTKLNQSVSYMPVYTINNKCEAVLLPEIVIKQSGEGNYDMTEITKKFGMTLKKDGEIYQLYSLPTDSNPIAIANSLYETGCFDFAYPHFFMQAKSSGYIPNDTYFQYQITCHNTGQVFNDGHFGTYDADIDAPEAWEITKGSSSVVVAVFDEGITSNHPDLPNTRQLRLDGSNFGLGDPNNPSPQRYVNHGNACAGVIAATMDNNEGIAGIAPNCKIMPIRWDETTDDTRMADGIKFAVDNGANIISCSWGYDEDSSTLIPAIVTAIEYAISNGVIVVFAAGNTASHSNNDDGYVKFPACANINNLITVGASDRYDKIAEYSPSSSLIDIVAPSHRAYSDQINGETYEMWTLDIPDDYGYNPTSYIRSDSVMSNGEVLPSSGTNYFSYTGRFGGTSHACPVVAGVVALMLSVNPTLSPSQVFSILTETSDKVGGYLYTNGKSNELGFGRVNAYAAVFAAKIRTAQINGPEILSSQSTYSVTNVPVGASIKWTYTFTPSNTHTQMHRLFDPIIFVNGDSTASVLVERGKYPAVDSMIVGPVLPPGGTILNIGNISTNDIEYRYFTGTAVLKATITSGGYSYTAAKTITLSSSSTTALALEIGEETNDIIEDNTNLLNSAPLPLYNLRHTNPISSSNAIIYIEKLLDSSNVYIPYDENYTIEIWHHQLGLIKRVCNTTSNLYLDCGDLPTGVYQMILNINGEPVAQSKLLKL